MKTIFCNNFLWISISMILTFISCQDQKEPQESYNEPRVNIPEPERTYEPREPVYERISEDEIYSFLSLWGEVYSTNTYDSYIRMYDPEYFIGIKRTFTGQKNTYNYQGWLQNKRDEFRKFKPTVTIDNIRIKYTNRNGKSVVNFLQSWYSSETNYADQGEKTMTIVKKDGELLIQREELLYSKPIEYYD